MKKFLIILFSIIIGSVICEIILRTIGYRPGIFLSNRDIQSYWYEYDGGAMQQYEFFKPDSLGLFKTNQELVMHEKNPPESFKVIINALKEATYNKDGFRGREFSDTATSQTKILFLGDSYTFGFDAEPFDSSYVNVLENIDKNFRTYNGGVPGSDLASYAVVAENYIPKIKPGVVVVCITKDDNVPYDKVLKPYENSDIFFTSKGLLYKINHGYAPDSIQVFNDAQDAYDNLLIRYTSKFVKPPFWKWVVDHSALVTLIYGKLYKPDLSRLKNITIKPRQDHSMQYVDRIVQAANQNHAKLIFTIIPKTFDEEREMTDVRKVVGDSVQLYFPRGITPQDFGSYHKAHFNNKGHRYYANFLDSVISVNIK